jgi:ATP-binding cassette subfamily B protein
MVFQQFNLFPHMNVLRNITEAPVRVQGVDLETARTRARELLAMVGLEDRADARPSQLSGGQKQRVAIARALLLGPRILILDDSTSSVDLTTEAQIQRALETLMQGRTSFVIAQRISTVINADKILVLDKGEIVAQGQHAELMEEEPIYAEIYNSQLLPESASHHV